ncbi:MAG: phosphatidylserine/phosphatidylglycerophosphate/cardiolipin synthase family protein [Microcoleaceae cyanobacterium]
MPSIIFQVISIAFGIIVSIVIILYFKGYFRDRNIYKITDFPSPTAKDFVAKISGLSDSFCSIGKISGFRVGANEIFAARLAAIQSAQASIQFETYIMTPGSRADDFATALIQKAQQGVQVQLIVDHYGVKSISKSYWKRLSNAGVEVRFFNQFSWRDPLYYLRRNHRKLLLIDERIALVGGAGISNDWDGTRKDLAPWLDYEVYCQGEILQRLRCLFLQHWLDAGGTANFSGNSSDEFEFQNASEPHDHKPTLVTSGENPTDRDSSIRSLYQLLTQAATQRVWIASPYFLPDRNTQIFLQRAKQRGVDVRILTMGSRCDKPFIHYTSRERYGELLRYDIEVYEYQPSMMHAKLILVDKQWVSLGSANLDPRSFFQNDELNLSTASQELCQQIESFFLTAFQNSKPVNLRTWKRRSIWERMIATFWLLFYWQL